MISPGSPCGQPCGRIAVQAYTSFVLAAFLRASVQSYTSFVLAASLRASVQAYTSFVLAAFCYIRVMIKRVAARVADAAWRCTLGSVNGLLRALIVLTRPPSNTSLCAADYPLLIAPSAIPVGK